MLITQKHKQRKLAEMAAASTSAAAKPAKKAAVVLRTGHLASGEGSVTMAALNQDLSALSDITDVAKKTELKKSALIPKWQPIVDSYLATGAQHPYEPLVWLAIWLLDAEQIPLAIYYADAAINQQQSMPKRFKCTLPEFMAEGIHNWAQCQLKASASAEPYFGEMLVRVESKRWLVDELIVLTMVYKLAAQFSEAEKDFKKAEAYYLKCIEVNPEKHGVKTALGRVQAALAKTQQQH